MKRHRILLLLALAAVTAGIVLSWPRGPKEPLVEGKRITVWLWEILTEPQPVTFTNANTSKKLRATATNAVPYLVYQFTRPRSKWQATWKRWVSVVPGIDFSFDDDDKRLAIAGWGLYLLGPEAAPAVPTLAGYLGEIDRGDLAATVMAGVGEQALPWLLKATASTNPVVAQHAMNGLVKMTQESEPAVHALIRLLRDTNSAVRRIVAMNLRHVVTRPDLTVQPLAAALADPEREVRLLAAHSLGEMGYSAQSAVPALVAALADPEPEVCSLAAHALGKMYSTAQAQSALPALRRLISNTNASLASAASNAVFRIDSMALPANRR